MIPGWDGKGFAGGANESQPTPPSAMEEAQKIVSRWTHQTNRGERVRDIARALSERDARLAEYEAKHEKCAEEWIEDYHKSMDEWLNERDALQAQLRERKQEVERLRGIKERAEHELYVAGCVDDGISPTMRLLWRILGRDDALLPRRPALRPPEQTIEQQNAGSGAQRHDVSCLYPINSQADCTCEPAPEQEREG